MGWVSRATVADFGQATSPTSFRKMQKWREKSCLSLLPIHVRHPAGINCEARIQSSSITHSIRNQPRCPDILRNSRAFEVNTVTNILLGFPCDDNAYLITKIGYFRTQDATTTTSKDFPGPPAGLTRLPTCLTCRNSCCADRLRVQHE